MEKYLPLEKRIFLFRDKRIVRPLELFDRSEIIETIKPKFFNYDKTYGRFYNNLTKLNIRIKADIENREKAKINFIRYLHFLNLSNLIELDIRDCYLDNIPKEIFP